MKEIVSSFSHDLQMEFFSKRKRTWKCKLIQPDHYLIGSSDRCSFPFFLSILRWGKKLLIEIELRVRTEESDHLFPQVYSFFLHWLKKQKIDWLVTTKHPSIHYDPPFLPFHATEEKTTNIQMILQILMEKLKGSRIIFWNQSKQLYFQNR